MAEPLKHLYNDIFFKTLVNAMNGVLPAFQEKQFLRDIHSDGWERKELKERIRHVAGVFHAHVPGTFSKQVVLTEKIIASLRKQHTAEQGLAWIFLPEFVERYGIEEPDTAIPFFEFLTQFVSCEFAVRPFIMRYEKRMMKQMLAWATHPDHHVRRLASEGCRPRLPWAMALPVFKKDPSSVLPVLEKLKADPSEYVRRSVANNLNDISKDHPELVLQIGKRWMGNNEATDKIIKHACRGLLKKGNATALSLFKLSAVDCTLSPVKLAKKTVRIGEDLMFTFELRHSGKKTLKLRIEYGIYYLKSNGKQNRKLFKLTENQFEAGTAHVFSKKQSFLNRTTRNHYPGMHAISIVVNGKEYEKISFKVTA